MHGLMYYPKLNNLLTTIRSRSKVCQNFPPSPSSLLPPNSLYTSYQLQSHSSFHKEKLSFYSNYSLAFFIVLSFKCISLDACFSPLCLLICPWSLLTYFYCNLSVEKPKFFYTLWSFSLNFWIACSLVHFNLFICHVFLKISSWIICIYSGSIPLAWL